MDRMNPLEVLLPGLAGSGYVVTSPASPAYNCIAWAVGETDRWWWPDAIGVGYWPDGVPREETLAAFLAAYTTLGYAPTANPAPEPDAVKVAIYARSGLPTHAARQLPSGRWTSKLGQAEDIEHDLSDLVSSIYGDVAVILARREG
jgi:hypothetical protein